MEIFVLLSHEYFDCSECGHSEYNLMYVYQHTFTRDELTLFLEENNYKYNSTQWKIYDYAGFERFEVRTRTIDTESK